MRIASRYLLSTSLLLCFAFSAFAGDRAPNEATIFDHQKPHFGLGVADIGNGSIGNQTSMSALIIMAQGHTLQLHYGLGSISPLTMSGGVVYRGRVDWFENVALHVGLGASMGSATGGPLFATFRVPVGVQIRIANALLIFLEGGPLVTVGGGLAANFTFGAFTANTLGAAVHYIF